jgi:hypothetical protein
MVRCRSLKPSRLWLIWFSRRAARCAVRGCKRRRAFALLAGPILRSPAIPAAHCASGPLLMEWRMEQSVRRAWPTRPDTME